MHPHRVEEEINYTKPQTEYIYIQYICCTVFDFLFGASLIYYKAPASLILLQMYSMLRLHLILK